MLVLLVYQLNHCIYYLNVFFTYLYINYYKFNYTTLLILGVIIDNIIKYYKEIKYLFNKFLLERYMYKLSYPKTKKINKINNMYKDKYHVIKENNTYITEKMALSHKFERKNQKIFD